LIVKSRPKYEIDQAESLAWLAAAHTEAEAARAGDDFDREKFAARIARVIEHVGCPPSSIARRGHSVADIASRGEWTDNQLYDLPVHPHGSGSATRTRLYADVVENYFSDAYRGGAACSRTAAAQAPPCGADPCRDGSG